MLFLLTKYAYGLFFFKIGLLKNWKMQHNLDNARAECKKKSMDVVNVETREENVCIQRQLDADGGYSHNTIIKLPRHNIHWHDTGLSNEGIWMGLMKTGGANYTAWLNGKQLAYTDWDAGNPAQYATKNCVMFKLTSTATNKKWL